MASERLSAKRGMPEKVCSDNGSNFQGASFELKEALRVKANEQNSNK